MHCDLIATRLITRFYSNSFFIKELLYSTSPSLSGTSSQSASALTGRKRPTDR